MALPPLADVADLNARGIETSNETLINALLASASEAIRDAAGVPITQVTATVTLPTPPGRRLRLPATPVRVLTAVGPDRRLDAARRFAVAAVRVAASR